MQIDYQITHNKCFSDNKGIIEITSINFTKEETDYFSNYTIEWSGDLSSSKLSNDHRILTYLKNGIYSFKLINNKNPSIISEVYILEITSPPEFTIVNIHASEVSCGNNGSIQIEISGGLAPYSYSIGGAATVSSDTKVKFENLLPGTYPIIVSDHNGCSIIEKYIHILDSSPLFTLDQFISPIKFNDYGGISFEVNGYGPFLLEFYSNTNKENNLNIDYLDNNYQNKIDSNCYHYVVTKLYPDDYKLKIIDKYGCSTSIEFTIPNIQPIYVNPNILADTNNFSPLNNITLPIFDTLLIPYKYIVNNTKEWEHIKKYNLKDHIFLIINDTKHKFLVSNTFLNKQEIDNGKIEIVKLGNTEKDWFYCFHIAPGINLIDNQKLIDSKIYIEIGPNYKVPITLGLNRDKLDSNNISLIKGSFIVSGAINYQFKNCNKCYIVFHREVTNTDEYVFSISHTNMIVQRNSYLAGLVTTINFLNNFDFLVSSVNTNQNFCELTAEQYDYISHIKQLLLTINNINYINNTYIYTKNSIDTGYLSLNIKGQNEFYFLDNTIQNEYSIQYYYFNDKSEKLSDIVINNKLAINTLTLKNLKHGFYTIRIKDKFNNYPEYISLGNHILSYLDHYTTVKQYMESYNKNILPLLENGDIIVYIPNTRLDPILTQIKNIPSLITIDQHDYATNVGALFDPKILIISQTNNSSYKSTLNINIFPKQTKCILSGPNNYILEITEDTKLINMTSGVYIIKGDDKDILDKNLYQKTVRILIDNNNDNNIDIIFDSYKNMAVIKE